MTTHRPFKKRLSGRTAAWIALAALILVPAASGQVPTAPSIAKKADEAAEAAASKAKAGLAGGAPLKTDPELERLLERADQFLKQDRVDVAVVLWQKVLDESKDTLVTRGGRVYQPLAEQVERSLSALPPEGLKAYRLHADGEAKALLASGAGGQREAALRTVVQRYFLSSVGDLAALELASLQLDRYDFVGASRLLSRLLTDYPDLHFPREEAEARLAVAAAKLGDRESAQKLAQNLSARAPGRSAREVASFVSTARASDGDPGASGKTRGWNMPLGEATRRGRMPALPAGALAGTLTELWSYEFPLRDPYPNPNNAAGGQVIVYPGAFIGRSGRMVGGAGVPGANQPAASREALLDKWKQTGWLPATQLLFEGDRLYFKTLSGLGSWSTAQPSDAPEWETRLLRQYEGDGLSQYQMQMGMMTGRPVRTLGGLETLLFGDRIHQSLSLSDGIVFTIEGYRINSESERNNLLTGSRSRQFQWGMVPRRTRRNWLTAYQAETGNLLWSRPADETAAASRNDAKASQDIGFMGAPVGAGANVLVPVTDGGQVWVYALSKSSGTTAWKTYLCDEPSGGAAAYSPVCIALDGSEAYVCAGTGVVFAVDAGSGVIRWAARYERSGQANPQAGQPYGNPALALLQLRGWSEEMLIPHGAALLVMASDRDSLLALDRRSGEVRWEAPRSPAEGQAVEYCVGVAEGGVYVAGRHIVERIDISSGRLAWQRELKDSLGRGMIAGDSLYMPDGDSIRQFELREGKELAQVGVWQTSSDPVGNIYSDGEKIWVTGLNRLAVLTNANLRLSQLTAAIDKGDPQARSNRMRLYARLGDFDKAHADLLGLRQALLDAGKPAEAAARLIAGAEELGLAVRSPGHALRIAEMSQTSGAPATENQAGGEDIGRRRDDLRLAAFGEIQQKKLPGLTADVLQAAPRCTEPHLLTSAGMALAATARDGDFALIKQSLESKDVPTRALAATGLGKFTQPDSAAALKPLLDDADERVRLAAARSLVGLKDRSGLKPLIALLESPTLEVRTRAAQTLRSSTGQQIAYAASDAAENRATGVKAWQEWLAGPGASVELKSPAEAAAYRGLTIVCNYALGQVTEYDIKGTITWQTQLPGAWGCVGLPDGHRLVTSYQTGVVVEYDAAGKEIWRKDRLPSGAFSARRLENGNTLIACSDNQTLWEFNSAGKQVWTARVEGRPTDVQRLENGNTLAACQTNSRVVEINPAGEVIWKLEEMGNPTSAERLDNGNTLVSQAGLGRVVEVDAKGRILWKKDGLPSPLRAQRLANGNTLIADQMGVHEFDKAGKQVWEVKVSPVSGANRY